MISLKSLFKKQVDLTSPLKVDLHSHLIPSIDDGAKDMQSSLTLIKELKSLGYTKLITTPHIKQSQFPNSSNTIKSSYYSLIEELNKNSIDIELKYAAEYYIDEHFMSLLDLKDILTFGNNYLLFEFSYHYRPINMLNIIYEMQESGYNPVLAHPERYLYLHRDFDTYLELKNRDVYFQLNINSLIGYYSKPVQKIAKKLCDFGLVDFLGSDTHHLKHIINLKKVISSKSYGTIFQKNTILNDTL
jgi:tyrosine-protein phosphatase YwqE